MPVLTQAFIDEVRSIADIVMVISDHVSLRNVGGSYKAACPFHADARSSFHVSRDQGQFHCFECQVSGDVFKFIELHERVEFGEAVRQVARRFGILLPEP
jgi:DNA primase